MAVHKRAYRPYGGELTAERWRFLVLPRYGLLELFEINGRRVWSADRLRYVVDLRPGRARRSAFCGMA